MPELFTVHTPPDAWETFRQHVQPLRRTEIVAAVDALDRVLAEALTAPHDLPSFVRSTVDGYAVAAHDTYGASASLPAFLTVVGEVPMGQAAALSLGPGECAEVHTGGMLPRGADAVVMLEQTEIVDAGNSRTRARSEPGFPYDIEVLRAVAVGQNAIQPGEDVRAGEPILAAGHRLRPQDLGGLLALGITRVTVAEPPRVAILSQGDEVVPPDVTPGPGQIRDINSYTLAALTRRAGGQPHLLGIAPDSYANLQALAQRGLETADVLVISAGSSVSVRDMTADVIRTLGEPGILVHGLSVRPGKPTIMAVCNGKPVFGLPGNPVSAMVIFDLVVAPTLRALHGEQAPPPRTMRARLARPLASVSGREDYVPVRLDWHAGEPWAMPIFGKSNLIYTLIQAAGMIRIPLDNTGIDEGEWVVVSLYA